MSEGVKELGSLEGVGFSCGERRDLDNNPLMEVRLLSSLSASDLLGRCREPRTASFASILPANIRRSCLS